MVCGSLHCCVDYYRMIGLIDRIFPPSAILDIFTGEKPTRIALSAKPREFNIGTTKATAQIQLWGQEPMGIVELASPSKDFCLAPTIQVWRGLTNHYFLRKTYDPDSKTHITSGCDTTASWMPTRFEVIDHSGKLTASLTVGRQLRWPWER